MPSTIDRDSGWPLEAQVIQMVRDCIADGRWAPGASLPSDAQLARELDVSIDTVQRGLQVLVAENLLTRRRGIGTRVADPLPVPRHVHVVAGAVIAVRLPLAGERAATGAGKWSPLVTVKEPGKSVVSYPAPQTVIIVR